MMSDHQEPSPPEDVIGEPDIEQVTRSLALHEILSLSDSLRQQGSQHVYTKAAFRRDRIIGWTMAVVIFVGLGWALYFQYTSTQELRQRTYDNCVERNVAASQQRALYRSLAAEIPSGKTSRIISQSASGITLVNCNPLR